MAISSSSVGRPISATAIALSRQNLGLRVSRDAGKSWSEPLVIESGPSAYSAKKAGLDGVHEQMRQDILSLHTDAARREWIEANLSDIQKMPRAWRVILRADMEEQAAPATKTSVSKRAMSPRRGLIFMVFFQVCAIGVLWMNCAMVWATSTPLSSCKKWPAPRILACGCPCAPGTKVCQIL